MIVNLADGSQRTLPDVRSFRLPRDNGSSMIYASGADTTARGDSSAGRAGAPGGNAGGAGGRGGRGGAAPAGPRRAFGTTIVLRNLDTTAEEKIADVLTYTFDDSAKVLAYTVASRDSTKDGVYLRTMATGAVKTVASGRGNDRDFSLDHRQQQFIFSTDRDEFGKPNAKSTLFIGSVNAGVATPVITPSQLPTGMRLADNGAAFTRSGAAIRVNLAPPPEDTIPADSLVGKAVFDLWHDKDAQLQPTQKLQLGRERSRTYDAVYHVALKKVVQLTTDAMPTVTVSDDERAVDPATGEDRLRRSQLRRATKSAERGNVSRHQEHLYRLPESLGRQVAGRAHKNQRRKPVAEGLQLGQYVAPTGRNVIARSGQYEKGRRLGKEVYMIDYNNDVHNPASRATKARIR